MTSNPRQSIKRDLDQSINLIETAQQYLVRTGLKYEESHPEITAQYKTVYALAEQLKECIVGLRNAY